MIPKSLASKISTNIKIQEIYNFLFYSNHHLLLLLTTGIKLLIINIKQDHTDFKLLIAII